MIEILANFYRSVIALTPDDLLPCVYLCLNKLAPAYEGVELGIGETLLMKAIAQSTGKAATHTLVASPFFTITVLVTTIDALEHF